MATRPDFARPCQRWTVADPRIVAPVDLQPRSLTRRARAGLNPKKAIEHLIEAQAMAVRGRCGVMERHIVRELIAVGEEVDRAPGLARLVTERDRARLEHQLQEVVGLLIPMIRAGHDELVARVCGGLTRSIWRATADVQFANDHVCKLLGYERHKALYSEGRRWAPDETVAAVLALAAESAIDTPILRANPETSMTGRPLHRPIKPTSKWSLVGTAPPWAVRVESPITSKGARDIASRGFPLKEEPAVIVLRNKRTPTPIKTSESS